MTRTGGSRVAEASGVAIDGRVVSVSGGRHSQYASSAGGHFKSSERGNGDRSEVSEAEAAAVRVR